MWCVSFSCTPWWADDYVEFFGQPNWLLLSDGEGGGVAEATGRKQRWSSILFRKGRKQCCQLCCITDTKNLASALMNWLSWMTLTTFFNWLWIDTLNCHRNFHSLSLAIMLRWFKWESRIQQQPADHSDSMVVKSLANAFIVCSWTRHYLSYVSLPSQWCRQSFKFLHNGHLGDRGKCLL